MKPLEPFDYTPDYQPDEANPVTFRLKPLDLPGQIDIRASFNDQGVPTSAGYLTASKYIVGWTGEGLGEFSRARVREITSGRANPDWMIWLGFITGHLYRQSILEGDEAKKS